MSPASVARIEGSPIWRARRIEVFDLPEGRVLVKGQRPTRSPWPHRLLNLFARAARVPYLKAVPVHGGAASQTIELQRLSALGSAGIAVPAVRHVAENYFVMDYLGPKDLAVTLRERGMGAFDLWFAAAQQLLAVHAQGEYLSQCFARNMIVSDRFEGLIDFEDDPLEVMSLVQAQARDWLVYLQSTLLNLGAPADVLDQALHDLLGRELPAVRAVLRHAARRLAWLRWLPRRRSVWGKDFVSLQAVGQALHRHHLLERT